MPVGHSKYHIQDPAHMDLRHQNKRVRLQHLLENKIQALNVPGSKTHKLLKI